MDKDYYSSISSGYDELYGDEQRSKAEVIKRNVKLKPLLLDVGCGSGPADFKVKSVGIDPSFGLLKKYKGMKICAKAEALPFKDKSFSSVVSLTALHHADISKAMPEIKRVSKRDAVFAFSILKKANGFKKIVSDLKSAFKLDEIDHEKDVILVKH